MRFYPIILMFCLLLGRQFAYAQIQVQQLSYPEQGLLISSFPNAQLVNSGAPIQVDLRVTIKSRASAKPVLVLTRFAMNLPSGLTSISSASGNWKTEQVLSEFFPMNFLKWGTYEVCFEVFPVSSIEPLSEDCQSVQSNPLTPSFLISPVDKEEVNQLNPLLIWQGPGPLTGAEKVDYKLKLVLVNPGQTEFEAIKRNNALFQTFIQGQTNIVYPTSAIPLQYNQWYAWQVKVLQAGQEIGATEIWKFIPRQDTLETLRQRFARLSFSKMESLEKAPLIKVGTELTVELDGFDPKKEGQFSIRDENGKQVAQIEPMAVAHLGSGKILIDLNAYKMKSKVRYSLTYTSKDQSLVLFFQLGN